MTGVTIVAETGSLSRFQNPRQLMSYSGLVSSEYSSGNRIQRGGNHQDRQRSFATSDGRSSLGLPTQTLGGRLSVETTTRSGAGNQGHRLEGAVALVYAL